MSSPANARFFHSALPAYREVPFHRADVGEAEIQAVAEVLRSGWLTMGPKTLDFELEFARVLGVKHAIAVSSCTAALHLALEAAGVRPGDEVLVPTTTFTATAEVVVYLGATPVLVDVDPVTLNLDPVDAARRITPRTKAILPVHFAGHPCDMAALLALASGRNLALVEDAAHALPAAYRGVPVGRLSELAAFSFYATKTLTTGEGGMITTSSDALAERMRLMRLHGIGRDAWNRYAASGSWHYDVLAPGYKYNLTDFQSAMGLVQLAKCDAMRDRRREIAEAYSSAFASIPQLETPRVEPGCESAWHLYVLRLNLDRMRIGRDHFIRLLRASGIVASVHFIPLHKHTYYRETFAAGADEFPVAEREYARCLSLPLFPGMSPEDIQYVIAVVASLCGQHRA